VSTALGLVRITGDPGSGDGRIGDMHGLQIDETGATGSMPWLGDGLTSSRSDSAMNRPPANGHGDFSSLIVAVAQRADRGAFAVLFSHFAPRVKSYLLRLGAAPESAEELAQETLLIVWRRAASFDPGRAAASTWIFTIARNLRIDLLRRERRPVVTEDPSTAPEPTPQPEAIALMTEQEIRIAAAVAQLPSDQAEVIRLSFFADKPHSEIAGALNLPLGTVKSRVRLAMTRLRLLLDEPV
jgi:RNA polymerase sigma-70 factor (ECF subfamily)